MNNLPEDMNKIIFSYLFKCNKHRDYIINRESLEIFNEITCDCEKIFIFRKLLISLPIYIEYYIVCLNQIINDFF